MSVPHPNFPSSSHENMNRDVFSFAGDFPLVSSPINILSLKKGWHNVSFLFKMLLTQVARIQVKVATDGNIFEDKTVF